MHPRSARSQRPQKCLPFSLFTFTYSTDGASICLHYVALELASGSMLELLASSEPTKHQQIVAPSVEYVKVNNQKGRHFCGR